MTRLGRLLCRMRLHRWRVVTVIDKFDLLGVTLTREQFDAVMRRWPPAPAPAFPMPWEHGRGLAQLTGIPIWIGGAARMRGRVVRSHREIRCERCRRPRP